MRLPTLNCVKIETAGIPEACSRGIQSPGYKLPPTAAGSCPPPEFTKNRFPSWCIRLSALLLGIALLIPTVLSAQTLPLSVSIDQSEISTDELLILTIQIHVAGGSVPQPTLPRFSEFDAVSSSSTQQLNIINGVPSTTYISRYQLRPLVTGELTIGEVSVEVDGEIYRSEPLTVTVRQGTGQPSLGNELRTLTVPSALGDKEYYVEAVVDKPAPYVGEKVLYTFRFYEALDPTRVINSYAARPNYRGPAFTGFWVEGEVDVTTYRIFTNGRRYNVTELKTVLFPTAEGSYTIAPSLLEIPDSAFQPSGTIRTEPIQTRVKPLPAGAPASFIGAVGLFDIQADVSTTQINKDEPLTLRITVSGDGNLPIVADPQWPEESLWRRLIVEDRLTSHVREGSIHGEHLYEWLMLPTMAGELQIPALEVGYFNPIEQRYQTASTAAIAITVLSEGAGAAVQVAPTVRADDIVADQVTLLPVSALAPSQAPLTSLPLYWSLWLLPVCGCAVVYGRRRRRDYLSANRRAIRGAKAHRQAGRKLRKLQRVSPGMEQTEALRALLYTYLEARLGGNINGQSHDLLTTALAAHGVDETTIQQTVDFFRFTERLQFQPDISPAPVTDLPERVRTIVNDLDGQFDQ